MNQLLKLNWLRQKYDAYKALNGFFYFLRKIPLIGKRIPTSIYKTEGLKTGLHILFSILSIPGRFLAKCFWLALNLGIGVFWTNILSGNDKLLTFHSTSWLLGFLIWWLVIGLSFQLGSSFSSGIPQADREFMDNFRLLRRSVLLQKIWLQPILTSLFYLPALIVFSLLANNWCFLLVGLLTPITSSLLGHSLSRCVFHYQISQKNQTHLWWAICLAGYILAIPTILFQAHLTNLFPLLIFLLQVIFIPICSLYLRTFPELDAFLVSHMENSLASDLQVAQIKAGNQYTRQGLQMKEKLTLDSKLDLSHLSGMAYLNALLFQRYRSILWKQLRTRLICISLVGMAGVGYSLYSKNFMPESLLIEFMPLFFMVMYACSMGRPIAQMVFVNCDIAMLHYPFYREGKTILAGFRYRFFKAIQYNGISALSMFLFCLAAGGFQYKLATTAPLALLLTSLTALFSFHDLFIYYILQPFTKDMEVTNPLYKFLSGALYWVAYLNTRIHIANSLYILGISMVLLLYVGIGYIILLKKAPKTFRMKQ
ncbi:hypothetical protein K6V78_04395 [Streptococcus gallolyticus]|nr:hypothetical protein [Streptococcus gallolyticus]MBY5040875.1 hypothetical protein [Streptococcus gallolyticus]